MSFLCESHFSVANFFVRPRWTAGQPDSPRMQRGLSLTLTMMMTRLLIKSIPYGASRGGVGVILIEALALIKMRAGRYCGRSRAVVEALAGAEEEAAL